MNDYTPQEQLQLAEARKATAEAEKLEAERDRLRTETEMYALKVRAENTIQKYDKSADMYLRVIHFDSDVCFESVAQSRRMLQYFHEVDPTCDITIIFNSPGGDVIEGLAFWDYLTELKRTHKITTVCRGMAASMAGVLMQAGDHRVMGRESFMLIHEGSMRIAGSKGEIKDYMELSDMITKRLLEILSSKSNLTEDEIVAKWDRKNWWLDANTALSLGFVDEVI